MLFVFSFEGSFFPYGNPVKVESAVRKSSQGGKCCTEIQSRWKVLYGNPVKVESAVRKSSQGGSAVRKSSQGGKCCP
ncbi:hypothetical protein DPMN_063940 [Dreissena polymorpha]|uniref:Uncharacterized protein n=1 Tax=Dreissena polymorpha TaxID=45954 RepID=A0A9D4CCA8_DREPO|nr:hypothetical protein DPMN_063940 [Dreissena polymorpha]